MESPSLCTLHVNSDDRSKMVEALDFLVAIGKAFYFSPNNCGLRIRVRSRRNLGKIEREMRALGMRITKHYD